MQNQCDDGYSECSQPISDTKLQLEDDNMDDSQDIRHQVDFDNDSEQVAEEVDLIELLKLCINVILLTKESRQLAKGSNNWLVVSSFLHLLELPVSMVAKVFCQFSLFSFRIPVFHTGDVFSDALWFLRNVHCLEFQAV